MLGQSAPSTPSQETKESTPSGTPATSTPTQGETQKKRGRPGNSTPAAAAATPTTEVKLKIDQSSENKVRYVRRTWRVHVNSPHHDNNRAALLLCILWPGLGAKFKQY